MYASYLHNLKDKGLIDDDTLAECLNPSPFHYLSSPMEIEASPRLYDDLKVLSAMFQSEVPIEVTIRSTRLLYLLYGFCDASGKGFGSTMMSKEGIRFRVGLWGADSDQENSSNWKEFENSVLTLEKEGTNGNLRDSTVFLCTDNSTVERAFYKGNSSSAKLFDLVVRTKLLEVSHKCKIYISHVAGKRMMAQGTDAISRGVCTEGLKGASAMISFIPLDRSALDRHKPLVDWVRSWAGKNLEVLTPEDWYTRGHDLEGGIRKNGFWYHKTRSGTFLWSPPPAAADVAVEQLRISRMKRQDSTHIIICPRLLTAEWMRQFNKAVDFYIEIPAGCCCWPANMYEPLILGVCFPYMKIPPW